MQRDIIEKTKEHTDWISNILIINKKDKIHIFIDPFELNKCSKRTNYYQILTMEEIIIIIIFLTHAIVFSAIDAKNGFWQLK